MKTQPLTNVVLVDDHKLFRKGIIELINGFKGYAVLWEAGNGQEFTEKFPSSVCPDIVVMDINMPYMDGYETVQWLKKHSPQVKVLALSMHNEEDKIIKIITSGANGYILKDAEADELRLALTSIKEKGSFYPDIVVKAMLNTINGAESDSDKNKKNKQPLMSDREVEFIKLACTELTYKEIGDIMCVALRTVDGYRESLFEKLQVKNRVGLVLYAIKNNIVQLS